MSQKIPQNLRNEVALRANFRCEYCQIPDIDSYYGFQIDHIISRKHDGKTELDNLAYACPDCNRYKGSDLGTYLNQSTNFIRFFNPRIEEWNDHFLIDNSGQIIGTSEVGKATVKIFSINHPDRIIERRILLELSNW